MIPPVVDILLTDPVLKRTKFDLLNGLPNNVGARFADGEIIFSNSDTIDILNAIDAHLRAEKVPDTRTVYELHIQGVPPAITAAQLAANLRLWDNIRSLSFSDYKKPEKLVFSTRIFPVENVVWR